MRAIGWSMVIGGTAALVYLVRDAQRAQREVEERVRANLRRALDGP